MSTRPDRLDKVRAVQAAQAIWPTLSANEKHGVRFGMLPKWAADKAIQEYGQSEDGEPFRDFQRLFAVALMDCTRDVGGMLA